MANDETVGQKLTEEIKAALRGRNALIVVQTVEEQRGERLIFDAASKIKNPYAVYAWTATEGVTDITGKEKDPGKAAMDPAKILQVIREKKERSVWILRDFHAFTGNAMVCRALRSLARSLASLPANEARAIVILTPSEKIPPELVDHAVVVKCALPDRGEIAAIFDSVLSPYPDADRATMAPNGTKEAAVEAAVGLSAEAAARAFTKSLVTQGKKIVPAMIAVEKKAVVSARGVEWYEADPRGLDAVGGLENLKAWLMTRKSAFSEKARAFGLPAPKGVLIVGPPGGGKSLTAKAVAAAWGVPLLKLDMGGAKSKYVGESEANLRSALATVEAVGRCVVFMDELEKSISTGGGLDGGVSQDALGTLLTWMQERRGQSFVVATANDVSALPPELLRKGRFDEIFAVDLPTARERAEILRVTLRQYAREGMIPDLGTVVSACDGFVGSEIAQIVPEALYAAFNDGERSLTAEDLVRAAGTTVPLAKTMAEKIKTLRDWAKHRARQASAPEEAQGSGIAAKDLDLDADAN